MSELSCSGKYNMRKWSVCVWREREVCLGLGQEGLNVEQVERSDGWR